MPPVLDLEGVGIRFDASAEILSDLALRLEAGMIALVSGPPGSGKSMLVRVAALLQRPSRGSVRLFGENTGDLAPATVRALRRRIGIVESMPAMVRTLHPVDNVALPLRLAGVRREEARRQAAALLDGLAGGAARCGDRPVALARAIVADPGLVVVDDAERLDADLRGRLPLTLERLARRGTAVLLTGEDERLAGQLGTVMRLRLDGGRLRPVDSPAVPAPQPVAP